MGVIQSLFDNLDITNNTSSVLFPTIGVLVSFVLLFLFKSSTHAHPFGLKNFFFQRKSSSKSKSTFSSSNKDLESSDAAFELKVEPIDPGFDWQKELPRPYRPYKSGKWTMTMSIKNLPYYDWLLLDRDYQDMTDLRDRIVNTYKKHTVLTLPEATQPTLEMYNLVVDFLQQRFPQYFYAKTWNSSTPIPEKKGDTSFLKTSERGPFDPRIKTFYNAIRQEYLPTDADVYYSVYSQEPYNLSDVEISERLIRMLARTTQEDFLILMLDDDGDEYILKSGSFAFPFGFNPAEKVNLPLKQIHTPVPFYKEKIESSMDKFFKRVKVGYWVQRNNWGLQSHGELFSPGDEHVDGDGKFPAGHGTPDEEIVPLKADEVDFSNIFLRTERQSLFRLPKTKAMLFTIKTYMTSIEQIRETESEENSMNLIGAIHAMPPAMKQYKRADEWGPAVIDYLNRESDGIKKNKEAI